METLKLRSYYKKVEDNKVTFEVEFQEVKSEDEMTEEAVKAILEATGALDHLPLKGLLK